MFSQPAANITGISYNHNLLIRTPNESKKYFLGGESVFLAKYSKTLNRHSTITCAKVYLKLRLSIAMRHTIRIFYVDCHLIFIRHLIVFHPGIVYKTHRIKFKGQKLYKALSKRIEIWCRAQLHFTQITCAKFH